MDWILKTLLCKKTKKNLVIITGFEPFGGRTTNPSWLSVKEMSVKWLENKYNVNIKRIKIPVAYHKIDKIIPKLWMKFHPVLVIHVGLAASSDFINLEKHAAALEYIRPDNEQKLPVDNMNRRFLNCGMKDITTEINVQLIVDRYNVSNTHIPLKLSDTAGQFLCEYTYYTSLSFDPKKTLFVHVPDITNEVTAYQIAERLEEILELCLQQTTNIPSSCK